MIRASMHQNEDLCHTHGDLYNRKRLIGVNGSSIEQYQLPAQVHTSAMYD